MHIYDLVERSERTVSEAGHEGSWIQVDGGRVTWYRERQDGDVPTAEVMLAYRGEAPVLPSGSTAPKAP